MIPLIARAALGTSRASAFARTVVPVVAKKPSGLPKGNPANPRQSSPMSLMNAGMQLQSWGAVLNNWIPSVSQSTTVVVQGKKGTPAKNVLHVAMATAFGTLAKRKATIGDMAFNVQVDVMTNTVQVEYIFRTNIGGEFLASILNNREPKPNPSWWDSFWHGFSGGEETKRGVGNSQTDANTGISRRIENGDRPLPGKENEISIFGELADSIQRYYYSIYNMDMGNIIWADPDNDHSTTGATALGYIGKESVLAGIPPASLLPPKTNGVHNWPQPFLQMIGNNPNVDSLRIPETMVTRFDYVVLPSPDGTKFDQVPATNPQPPVPVLEFTRGKNWTYDTEAARKLGKGFPQQNPDIPPSLGYAFDLRSLVAQALSDPGVELPVPDSVQSLNPI